MAAELLAQPHLAADVRQAWAHGQEAPACSDPDTAGDVPLHCERGGCGWRCVHLCLPSSQPPTPALLHHLRAVWDPPTACQD